MNAWQIAESCRSGDTTPLEVARSCLNRIRESESVTRAFLQVFDPALLARAEALTREGPPAEGRGLLFGVPVAVKDNISVAGHALTCGSRVLEGYQPAYHATAVQRILDEGAVIVGKTNLDEFAMGSSTEHSAFGATRNPRDVTRSPGGSSGGSAAAVGSGAVPLALGSDTGGSIRQPASLCGIVGFKPTYGAVSRYGLVAFASSLDQIGPMARSARDAALLFEVMTGWDPMDSTSLRDVVHEPFQGDIEGLKIGVPGEYFKDPIEASVRERVETSIDRFTRAGARLVKISLPHTKYAVPAYYLTATSEASSNLARYDGVRYGALGRNFGPEVKRRIMLGTFSLSSGYYDAYYAKAAKVRRLIRSEFEEAFRKVDLIAGPTSPVRAFKLGEKTNDPVAMYRCDSLTTPASLAGLPGISVPCGGEGLPVGLQLLGPPLRDGLVLRAARAFEGMKDGV